MGRHFGETGDDHISQKLVATIMEGCEKRYVDAFLRAEKLAKDAYHGEVTLGFDANDISQAFKK